MDRALNREILRLSLPSILANLTVPLVGFVDTAVAGHLNADAAGGAAAGPLGAAAFIGAVSVGAMLFNLLYWNFGFLRTGTGGLTAQAFGRGDPGECGDCLRRSLALALAVAALTLALQWPFLKLALLLVDASPEVEALASKYFLIRIWAAPATLSLMAFSGWFVGMQDSVSSMWKDLVVSGVNIAASIILALGIGRWQGLGFAGVAWGTVAAQYSGLLFCVLVAAIKYGRRVFGAAPACPDGGSGRSSLRRLFRGTGLRAYFRMNLDLIGRSLGFTAIYIGYTMIAAGLGDLMLACSSLMMQILMIFSYFTDGFAYAGEALTGRFIGARDSVSLRRSVRYTFVWSMSIAVLFIFVYQLLGLPLLRLLTDDPAVVGACAQFLPWLVLMPPLGCAAFTWDGVYLGATASRGIRDAMVLAAVAFFAVWFGLAPLFPPLPGSAVQRMHLLLGAYFAHLLARTVLLSLRYRRDVLSKV